MVDIMTEMYILAGIPGSGKSFLAQQIRQEALDNGLTCEIYSTDNFWLAENGQYEFDASRLGEAHQWNQDRVLNSTHDVVVVDNTNTTWKERIPYLQIADKHKRDVIFAVPNTAWAWDVDECFKRNTHGVPRETIQRMFDRFQGLGVIE